MIPQTDRKMEATQIMIGLRKEKHDSTILNLSTKDESDDIVIKNIYITDMICIEIGIYNIYNYHGPVNYSTT